MAMVLDEGNVRVEVATPAQVAATIKRELRELGISYEDLAAQADADEFETDRARRLWFMISPLDD